MAPMTSFSCPYPIRRAPPPASSASKWWSTAGASRSTWSRRLERPCGTAQRERGRETTRRRAVEAAPERRERFETSSGIEVRDLYTPADAAGVEEERDLG